MIYDVVNGPFGNKGWRQFSAELRKSTGVIMYHGTSDVFLERILAEGVLPRGLTGNSTYEGRVWSGKSLESNPRRVYLIHRSRIGAPSNQAVNKFGGNPICIRVYVPNVSQLASDEDAKATTWYDSIAKEDGCSHRGRIAPSQILGWGARTLEAYTDIAYHVVRNDPLNVKEITFQKSEPAANLVTVSSARGHFVRSTLRKLSAALR